MDIKDLPYPKVGNFVKVVQKKDYSTGKLTLGKVKDILTKLQGHPRGTKVILENGVIGRIQEFGDVDEQKQIDKKTPIEKAEIIYSDEDDLV